ncbi:uncharacterized protein LOC114279924 [Camellia sinensis]|uniref:uncharacterized protein LOC114279924 n=1 Tax=Camellia sinensis TaxID=4442 RepID=UPI0010356153|nr:uncharacterized protein LOC114279924 [Camellia sinensis]
MGVPEQSVPSAPPDDMWSAEGLTPEEVDVAMLGTDAALHTEEGKYATYCHTYLMPLLMGVCTPTRRAAGAGPPPGEYSDDLLGLVASLEGMVLRRETQLFIAGVMMPPLQAGPSRPSRGAGRGDSSRRRGRRRAPIINDKESSEEKESAHPQSETSAGREEDSGSDSESGDDDEEGSEDGSSDSDDGADAEVIQPKRTKKASYSCA